jgi:hypothetical protein
MMYEGMDSKLITCKLLYNMAVNEIPLAKRPHAVSFVLRARDKSRDNSSTSEKHRLEALHCKNTKFHAVDMRKTR